jgi:DNA-binding response OmpR family regulator
VQRWVLVVDDEPMVVDVLRRYLLRDGFAVDVASSSAVALTEASRRPPDLVILGLMLPGIDGLEVCQTLRRSSQVPILMVTARGEVAERAWG